MKRLAAVVLIASGVIAVLFGLLFLVGSAGQASRLLVAALGLVLGGVAAGLGVRLLRQARLEDPAVIQDEILALAKREDGEISEHELRAALGRRWELGQAVLLRLQAAGTCSLAKAQGGTYYSFPHLLPRLAVRRCEFCQAELPLDANLTSCPQCGGTIRTGVQRLSVADDKLYSMD